MLSQFTSPDGRDCLANYIRQPGIYVAGRLDFDSEGLLLLTDDGRLQARISDPRYKYPKTYAVQVESRPNPDAFEEAATRLLAGIPLRDGIARAVSVRRIPAPDLPDRTQAVTPHRAARSSWVEVILTEGKNRQVRRMLAAVGMPVLRLIRTGIGPLSLEGLAPGEWETIPIPDRLLENRRANERPDRQLGSQADGGIEYDRGSPRARNRGPGFRTNGVRKDRRSRRQPGEPPSR